MNQSDNLKHADLSRGSRGQMKMKCVLWTWQSTTDTHAVVFNKSIHAKRTKASQIPYLGSTNQYGYSICHCQEEKQRNRNEEQKEE